MEKNERCPTLDPHPSPFSLKLEMPVLTHRSRTTSLMIRWMTLRRGTLFRNWLFFVKKPTKQSPSSVRRMCVRDPWSDEDQRGRAPPRPSSVCYHATGEGTSFFFLHYYYLVEWNTFLHQRGEKTFPWICKWSNHSIGSFIEAWFFFICSSFIAQSVPWIRKSIEGRLSM